LRILVDTSVWIEFFRGTASREREILKTCLDQREYIATSGIIVQEILQGIREDAQYRETSRFLSFFPRFDLQFSDHVEAANIYRQLRKRGLTIRSPIDCVIAALAMRGRFLLLHRDRDFPTIARFYPLKLYEESPS
jgi:predicted nucleic acid-binding protein